MYKSDYSKDFDVNKPTKNTQILLNEIKEATNIYEFIKNNNTSMEDVTFAKYLQGLLKEKNISKAKLLALSGLSRSFIYKLLNGNRIPSRDTIINLALCINASLDETYKMLTLASYQPLYARDIRDTIIIFGLNQKMDLGSVNDILFDLNIETIGLN